MESCTTKDSRNLYRIPALRWAELRAAAPFIYGKISVIEAGDTLFLGGGRIHNCSKYVDFKVR